MATIHLATDGQRLIKVECPKIASGDKNVDYLRVDWCPSWDGFSKTAVFYRNENDVYYAVIDADGECVIPWEVLQAEGVLYLGIFGVKDDARKTSEVISYKIDKGAITDNIKPSDPAPDIYDRLLAEITGHVADKNNPHGVTKSQVGLGNVPNVATNNQTPTYTVASALESLTSGEKLSVAFGKIAKAVADFISHIGNKSNPHGVTASQAGAAPAGYGLGTVTDITIAVLDGTNSNGWYRIANQSLTVGGHSANDWYIHVKKYSSKYFVQELIPINSRYKLIRWFVDEVVTEEWENPPLIADVEYRTTDRIDGKAVYKKNVNGVIQYRIDGETTWRNYSVVVGAAPAGFGFGDKMIYIDLTSAAYDGKTLTEALETVLASMSSYSCAQIQFYDTSFYSNKFVGKLWKYTANYVTLEAICYSGYKAVLRKVNGTWSNWEWENPPMEVSTEYRTTERWSGKVVYVQRLAFGALVQGENTLTHNLGIASSELVRFEGYVLNPSDYIYYSLPLVSSNGSVNATVRVNAQKAHIFAFSDLTSYNGYVNIWYTKD